MCGVLTRLRLSSLVLAAAVALPLSLFANGDNTLGPALGIDIADGSRFIVAGVGLDSGDGTQVGASTIDIDIPADVTIEQVLLYWEYFGEDIDTTATLNGSIPVVGEMIGNSGVCTILEQTPRTFRVDITDLGLVTNGANSIDIEGIVHGTDPRGRVDGAAIVAIVQDAGQPAMETLIYDGNDFAVGTNRANRCNITERQTFTFPPAPERRMAEVILLVGDHLPDSDRASALEVEIEMGPSMDFVNVLVGSEGRRLDLIRIPIEIPAGATEVSVQLFSENRTGTPVRVSSFAWFFTGLNFLEAAPPCTAKFRVGDHSVRAGECITVPVLMDSTCDIQGFSTALAHDPAEVTLDSINLDGTVSSDVGTEFFAYEIEANGGTAGVILDFESPFDDQTIPAGIGRRIVNYRYCCREDIPADSPGVTSALTFVDGMLGTPEKDNVVVIDGLSIEAELCDGTITCTPGRPDEVYFLCGGPEQDDDGNPLPIEPAAVGETSELCFYYCSPEDNEAGHAQFDHIQGLTMTVCFDCNLEIDGDDFHIPDDSIAAAIGTEFVSYQVDSDPNDGDGCEIIIGLLVDALPPFDGQTLPPSDTPLKLVCVDVTVGPDAPCGETLDISFCNGINGLGRVPLKNIYSAENHSFEPLTFDCGLEVIGPARFYRGDCNSNGMVEISDAAAVVSSLFLVGTWRYESDCPDACDCNDDGRIDLADTVCILSYLFLQGATPPAPGPGFDPTTQLPTERGSDPTDDKLDCSLRDCPIP